MCDVPRQGAGDWCNFDSGQTTITDLSGSPRNVYVSVTRDGSVWVKMGRDHASSAWVAVAETTTRFHAVILEDDVINVLRVPICAFVPLGIKDN